jgi:hypothetical protein
MKTLTKNHFPIPHCGHRDHLDGMLYTERNHWIPGCRTPATANQYVVLGCQWRNVHGIPGGQH